MTNNPEIEQIIESAVKIARERKHEYVITEHLLMSMVQYPPFRTVLEKFGCEVTMLEMDLSLYLDSLTHLRRETDSLQP